MSASLLFIMLLLSLFLASPHGNEVESLLAFKASIRADPFGHLHDWTPDSAEHYCNWNGIQCSFNDDGHCNSSVYGIHLSYSGLKGHMSPFIGNLSCLAELDLSNNELEGSIPSNFQNLSFLSTLYLSNNLLTNAILSEIGSISALNFLDVSGNQLVGAIPKELGSLTSLFQLDLSRNRFQGAIPPELGSLSSLHSLHLSDNLLSGTIPEDLSKLTNLSSLDLSNNSLTGAVPSWMFSKGWTVLDLSYNHLKGPVPYCTDDEHIILTGNRRLHFNCSSNNFSKKKGKKKGFILSAIVLGGFASVCISGFLWFLFIRELASLEKQRDIPWEDPKLTKISEQELADATDNFSVNNLVGIGGCAQVYRGVLPTFEAVAVKVFHALPEEDYEQEAAESSFLRECHTLGHIRHRNLVKIITACRTENIRAIVLQFMPNGSLHQLLHQPLDRHRLMPLSLKTRFNLIKDVASALSYLHNDCSPPIIHCDVKPHNVLLDEDMTAHLSDFGIARIMRPPSNTAASLGVSVRLEGSTGYIAPEYGSGVEPWSRGDVYSFGVVVLEVLTRMKPTDDKILNEQTLCDWVSMALNQGTDHWYTFICSRQGQKEISNLSNAHISVLEEVLKIGVWCCCQKPQARPTMREVEGLLCKICVEVVEEPKPVTLKSSLSGFLTSMETKAQASTKSHASSSSSSF